MRVLFLQPSLQIAGGGNAVGAVAIETLAADHDVSLLVWQRPDFARVDEFYGTRLAPLGLKVIDVPRLARAIDFIGIRGATLQRHVMFRVARRMADRYDLVISMANEIDIGRPAIQYIHFPWAFFPRPDYDLQWFHRLPGALAAYYGLAQMIAPTTNENVARNLTLTNSAWTGGVYESRYHAPWRVLYPPATGRWRPRPWEERDEAVAIVGRISHEKEIERAFRIVERLGGNVKLRVIGTIDHPKYYRRLRASSPPFVEYHTDIPRDELLDLLGRTRYGIHCMKDEHFGMVIPEMLHSGCIPFVREGGGAVEIVADARLTWATDDEAAGKLAEAMREDAVRRELLAHCAARAAEFTEERFRSGLRQAVADFVAR